MDQTITYKAVTITIRRDDLLHKFISGNKFRKLKYNIAHAQNNHANGIITFGGAFSNHIAATAAAGAKYNIPTVGVIRGEEWQNKIESNPTLNLASQNKMKFHFVTREAYKNRNTIEFINEIQQLYPDFYLIPEGGSNALAIKGCEEIINPILDSKYAYVCCAAGTGATISGIANQLAPQQIAIGFAALNDFSMLESINLWTQNKKCQLLINFDYNFGAYAKINDDLIRFINEFFNKFEIPLDPIYTGKMFYGIFDLIDKKIIPPHSEVLAIHTGGLQGIDGINKKLTNKNKEIIKVVF